MNRWVNHKLLDYLTRTYEHRDPIAMIEELMDEAAMLGRSAQTLADLVEQEARRLQAHWLQTAERGVDAMGRPMQDAERSKLRRWYQEITALLDGGDYR